MLQVALKAHSEATLLCVHRRPDDSRRIRIGEVLKIWLCLLPLLRIFYLPFLYKPKVNHRNAVLTGSSRRIAQRFSTWFLLANGFHVFHNFTEAGSWFLGSSLPSNCGTAASSSASNEARGMGNTVPVGLVAFPPSAC